MKTTMIAAAMAALIAAPAFAQSHDDHMVMTDDIAWQDVIPGVQLALAWGDPETGDDIWLLRLEPGSGVPTHAHTNDY